MTQRTRSALQTAIVLAALAVFWIACVATTHRNEMIVGAVSVALSTAFSLFIIRTLPLHFRPSAKDLAQVWRVPGNIITDLWVVGMVLLRSLFGRRTASVFCSAPWRVTGNSGRSTAKRTLATAYATLSPNCVVVGIDCKKGQILFHQLSKAAVPTLLRRLGTGETR